MNRFFDAMRRFYDAAGRFLAEAWRVTSKWLSVPINACLALLGLVFLISFCSWAIGDRFQKAVFYYPDERGRLRGEVREVPRAWGTEVRAELIASEVLLGPKDPNLQADFPLGTRLESTLYRKGELYVDISADAALSPTTSLKTGMSAMEKSLRAALPGIRRVSITIGGLEPYATGLQVKGKGEKKAGK
jgi:Sporulation and spore germination.